MPPRTSRGSSASSTSATSGSARATPGCSPCTPDAARNGAPAAPPARGGRSRGGAGARGPARVVRPAGRPLLARKVARPVDLAFELATEDAFEPLGDVDHRVEVDAGLDPFVLEQVDEILGRDVPARARGVRAAAQPS